VILVLIVSAQKRKKTTAELAYLLDLKHKLEK
jgi:hypothetical protein